MTATTNNWLSVHVFPEGVADQLLLDGLLPVVRQLRNSGQIQQYFFVRYPEGGFHFRLRLQVSQDQYFEVRQEVERQLEALEMIEKYEWVLYEPETDRYGGPVGVEIAEWQFHVCSEIVGYVLAQKRPDYATRTWLAMTTQLAFLRAMAFTVEEAKRFCRFFAWAWVPYAVGETDVSRMSREEILVGLEGVFTLFEKALAEQPEMREQLQLLWRVLGEPKYELEDWLQQWMAGNRKVKEALEQGWHALQPRAQKHRYPVREEGPADATEELRWSLYADYLHMLNNRLGIKNRDEAYIAWVVGEALQVAN